jgi:N,N'-diacetyllegionaminate synthase
MEDNFGEGVMKTLIIAEAGVNHNADLEMAFRLVDVAVEAGADVVKFQTAVPEEVVTKHAKMAEYQIKNTNVEESQLAMTKRIHLPMEDFVSIKKYCDSKNIEFATTAFGPVSLDFIQGLDLPFYKIPSGEITNIPYLRTIGKFGKPIILSTGMANLGEIEAAIDELERAGTMRSVITVLHCTTEYPAPVNEVNLRAMQGIGKAFGTAVGYSDHTQGIEVAIAAVAMGATVIEKHFTLDRNLPGPDHKASLEPEELKAMVAAIRNVEAALGDGIKRPFPSEAKNKPIARKSLVASQAINAGEVFSAQNITTKRPGTGISPMRWDEIIGKTATRDFAADELIEL